VAIREQARTTEILSECTLAAWLPRRAHRQTIGFGYAAVGLAERHQVLNLEIRVRIHGGSPPVAFLASRQTAT
jgi:hypothetical protein